MKKGFSLVIFETKLQISKYNKLVTKYFIKSLYLFIGKVSQELLNKIQFKGQIGKFYSYSYSVNIDIINHWR